MLKSYYANADYRINYINDEEKEFVKGYLRAIGGGDVDSQIKYFDAVQCVIDEKRIQAMEDEKKYKMLYIKIGVL